MAILLTGGTGKTSLRIASLLQNAKIPFLLASRRGPAAAPEGMPAVVFDWLDASTYQAPFEYELTASGSASGEQKKNKEKITAVYLVAPPAADPVSAMNAFVDHAIKEHGVKRFVLLGGSSTEKGSYHVGKVWEHLDEAGVGICVLRPTWFMENYLEWHRYSIKDESKIYSAFGDGKVPFISAKDIAAVAFRALTDPEPHNTDYRIVGPELLTHDQVAEKISKVTGRKIINVRLTEEERLQRYKSVGVPEDLAKFLTYLEVATAKGLAERLNGVVERVTGQPAQTFDAFAEENKAAWQ